MCSATVLFSFPESVTYSREIFFNSREMQLLQLLVEEAQLVLL